MPIYATLSIIVKALHGLSRQMRHFLTDMSNRVEHQNEPKRPQQLDLRQTPALINTYHIILIHNDRHVIHHLSIHWKGIQLEVGSHSSKSIDDE